MNKKKTLLTFVLLLFLVACGKDWEDGIYFIEASPENPSKKTLYCSINEGGGHGRVGWVKRIGSNASFIIVESSDNKFWILDKTKDSPLLNSNEIMIGPLSSSEFKKTKEKLGISNLEFTFKL